jgi:plastocyanin
MIRLSIVSVLLATLTAVGCSDNGGNSTGVAGSGGGAAGTGGGAAGTGGGAAGTGGGTPFMAVAPCNAATDYVAAPTTIDFGLLGSGFNYQPKCLKVATGTQVTFMSAGSDFVTHPLAPSVNRGTHPGNPITSTTAGNNASFTFATKGFWAYYCTIHGSADDGSFMAGVIWAD